jgi:hypothetical protein
MFAPPQDSFRVSPEFQGLVAAAGLSARGIFADPRIRVWRKLADRENATLDVPVRGGRPIRLHIKRYAGTTSLIYPHRAEVRGNLALQLEKIPTAPMVGYGKLTDRRCFTIFLDLAGYSPIDKLVEGGASFDPLLIPTADLAAKLHNANLHHRDLYLCHFMAKVDTAADAPAGVVDVKLIDVARVGRLSGPFFRRRWIIKDLAQFWFSTMKLPISDDQRTRWLARYAEQRNARPEDFLAAIKRKAQSIARHDKRLNASQPDRNVSIPA